MTTTQDEKRKKRELDELKKFAKTAPTPVGWSTLWREGRSQEFVMINLEKDIELVFYAGGDGTTRFKMEGSPYWRSFDRVGVSSSFYWRDHTTAKALSHGDVKKVVEGELARIKKSKAFLRTALTVPMIGHNISPDALPEYKRALATIGVIRFTPSGFGTGYEIVTRKPKHNYGVKRADQKLEDFFGRSPLWVVSFDCD
jgi:hypothetical protein